MIKCVLRNACDLQLSCVKSPTYNLLTSLSQVEVLLEVTDLHVITPAAFLELAGGSVHQLSYQQARNNSAPISGVYVADQGYMLARAHVPKHAIITALGGKPTPDLPAFAAVLRALPHGARVPVEFFVFSDRHRRKNTLLFVDRQWWVCRHGWPLNIQYWFALFSALPMLPLWSTCGVAEMPRPFPHSFPRYPPPLPLQVRPPRLLGAG